MKTKQVNESARSTKDRMNLAIEKRNKTRREAEFQRALVSDHLNEMAGILGVRAEALMKK